MHKGNRIFKTVIEVNIVAVAVGVFGGFSGLASAAVVALFTTAVLWEIFLREEHKAHRAARAKKRQAARAKRAGVKKYTERGIEA